MAEKQQTEQEQTRQRVGRTDQDEKQNDSEKTNPGVAAPEAFASADVQAAEKAGLTEGEFKALRDDAGVNQSAGHEANIHAWKHSTAGKAWADDEDEREKAEKEQAKRYEEASNKDGLTEAEAKYREAVDKG